MGRIAAAKHKQHVHSREGAILNAALQVFAEGGFAEATMDQVAAAAQLSKAALYLYFPSKDALLQTLLQRYSLLPELPAMLAALGDTPPAEGIPRLVREIWRLLKERQELARVLVREIQSNPQRAKLFEEQVGVPIYHLFAAYLEGWMGRGVLRPQHPIAAAQCLFGMLWFLLLTQEMIGGKDFYPLSDEIVVETVSRMFLAGAQAANAGSSGGEACAKPPRRARSSSRTVFQ
jgi:AcrR family transcriptional regulator